MSKRTSATQSPNNPITEPAAPLWVRVRAVPPQDIAFGVMLVSAVWTVLLTLLITAHGGSWPGGAGLIFGFALVAGVPCGIYVVAFRVIAIVRLVRELTQSRSHAITPQPIVLTIDESTPDVTR